MFSDIIKFLLVAVLFFYFACNGCVGIDLKGCSNEEPYIINPNNQSGDIYSPGFEEGLYPDYIHCQYTIFALPGHKVKLTFKELDIEPFENCGKDVLVLHDGRTFEDPVIGIFCGSEIPPPIFSTRNILHIEFNSDFLGGRKGYHLHYDIVWNSDPCPAGYLPCKNRNCYKKTDKCNGKDDCNDGTDEEKCNLPLLKPECGINPITPYGFEHIGVNRIIGGREARPGSWPWQADLQQSFYYPCGHMCGGTLIHPQWVLTAMHCVRGTNDLSMWRIHLGNHHKFFKDKYEQVRYVERIIVYPNYTDEEIAERSFSMDHDMALIKLSSPVSISDHVRPACLPPQGYELPTGTTLIATGWGLTRGSGSSEFLKQVELSTLATCSTKPSMICVRNAQGYQDVCHGDSGGPLVYKIGNAWNVMGITSFGSRMNYLSGLCGMNSTTVFNKVSDKTSWIQETIQRYS